MIRRFTKGSLHLVALLLLAYALLFLQVGRRTPYGHLVAIFSSQPAQEAAADFTHEGKALETKVVDEVKRQAKPPSP